ncbi:MAG TPA: hypothetical protein VE956_12955 [Nodularia sp. (in: cyanobacteria)]|nr:hypothetical protein [Nodularia sp. (in: cyanobacteria)]
MIQVASDLIYSKNATNGLLIRYIVLSIGYLCLDVDALWAAYYGVASGDREAKPNDTLGNRTFFSDVTKSRL